MKHSLLFFALFFTFQTSNAAVWDSTQTWNADWENRYHQWVETSWDKDFFARPGPFQNIKMDCADTVYSMRLIFALQSGLPFVINDSTGGKSVVSNSMSRWDSLPPEQRVRAFLLYVYEIVATTTLPRDSYPVAVSRDAIGSGRFLMTDAASHHSWTIKYVAETGVPFLLFASRPARTILFERFEFPSMGFTFPNGLKPERHAGFRAFRLPEDLAKPVWEVPGYSLEQYQIPYDSWRKTMQSRLQVTQESHEAQVHRLLSTVCLGSKERVEAVDQALAALKKIGSGCFDAAEYDDLSTPSRDRRLGDSFGELVESYQSAVAAGAVLPPEMKAQADSIIAGASDPAAVAFCPVEIASGQALSLGQIYSAIKAGMLSNNPHDPREIRWGLQPGPSEHAKACPVY
jgi:hypothetical protein